MPLCVCAEVTHTHTHTCPSEWDLLVIAIFNYIVRRERERESETSSLSSEWWWLWQLSRAILLVSRCRPRHAMIVSAYYVWRPCLCLCRVFLTTLVVMKWFDIINCWQVLISVLANTYTVCAPYHESLRCVCVCMIVSLSMSSLSLSPLLSIQITFGLVRLPLL